MPLNSNLDLDYSDAYRDSVFYIWYQNSRIAFIELEKIIPLDERNRKPRYQTLQKWCLAHNWHMWADGLDAKASEQMDMTVVEDRVQMYRKHAEMGQNLAQKGMEFIEKDGISSDSAAIRAIVEGIEIEGKNRGLADALSRVFAMNEKELDAELKKILTNKSGEDGDAINLDSDEIVDVEVENND